MESIGIARSLATHVVKLNGEEAYCNVENYEQVCEALIAKHGFGVPHVEPLEPESKPSNGSADFPGNADHVVQVTTPAEGPLVVDVVKPRLSVGQHDAEGAARSMDDHLAAIAAGFSPRLPVYRRGSRATGMEEHRAEFEQMPIVGDACKDIKDTIEAERRREEVFTANELRMDKTGRVVLNGLHTPITRHAIPGLAYRLEMPGGAGSYLQRMDDAELRAINVNRYARALGIEEANIRSAVEERAKAEGKTGPDEMKLPEPKQVTLRTRVNGKSPTGREVFAIVGEKYPAFDVDKIAEAVRIATPNDARCAVTYDGHRAKFDVVFFSNIDPGEAVAGEFFKAFVQVRTDDTGGGSIVVDGGLWQNLCLNFIIIDKARQNVGNLRHAGSVEKLAEQFHELFKNALGRIGYFVERWGYAQQENVIERSLEAAIVTGDLAEAEYAKWAGKPVSQVLPGIFTAMVDRALVPVPRRNKAETVGHLMEMWRRDESAATRDREGMLTRAAVVNAWTRYAHEVNTNPFLEPEIEAAAGQLLLPKGKGDLPAPLPFVVPAE